MDQIDGSSKIRGISAIKWQRSLKERGQQFQNKGILVRGRIGLTERKFTGRQKRGMCIAKISNVEKNGGQLLRGYSFTKARVSLNILLNRNQSIEMLNIS